MIVFCSWSWRGRGYSQESVDKRCTVEETPGKPLLCWWAEMVAVCELSLLPITPQRPQRWPALHLGFLGVVLVRDVCHMSLSTWVIWDTLGLHCLAQNVSHLWRFLSFCCLHIELLIGGHLEREWLWICCTPLKSSHVPSSPQIASQGWCDNPCWVLNTKKSFSGLWVRVKSLWWIQPFVTILHTLSLVHKGHSVD